MNLLATRSPWRRGRPRPAPVTNRPARLAIERLEQRQMLSVANDVYVASLFEGLLGRNASPTELSTLSAQVDTGTTTRSAVALSVVHGAEYRMRQVEDIYQTLLGRNADALGLNQNVHALLAAATVEQVKANVYGSDEFFFHAGGTRQGFLNVLFQNELGRAPDPLAVSTMTPSLTTGTGRVAVALQVLTSTEADQVKATDDFRATLGREPDTPGLTFWTNTLLRGTRTEDVLASFLASAEYFARLQTFLSQGAPGDPNQAGSAFVVQTNQVARSLAGVPQLAILGASTNGLINFPVTVNGAPFGPLRFPVTFGIGTPTSFPTATVASGGGGLVPLVTVPATTVSAAGFTPTPSTPTAGFGQTLPAGTPLAFNPVFAALTPMTAFPNFFPSIAPVLVTPTGVSFFQVFVSAPNGRL